MARSFDLYADGLPPHPRWQACACHPRDRAKMTGDGTLRRDMRDAQSGALMPSLDPTDWSELRSLGHRMLDDMFDHLGGLRDRPVWQPMPES